MEAAIVVSIGAPAGHAADVKLAVLGIEPAAMGTREEFAHQRHDRALGLPVYLVAQHQEMAPLTVREVNELSLQRSPAIAGDVDLAAAGIVQAARQVEQRQLGRLAILGAAEAEEGGH